MVHLIPIIALAAMIVAPALAGTTARVPSTTEGSASMTPVMLGDGGLAQYWWLVAIVLLAAAAFWFMMRWRRRTS
jgi:hypothetical protein